MKNFKKIVPIALGALVLASCSSDDLCSNVTKKATQAGENEMIAVVGDIPGVVTRYGMDNAGTMYVWSEGDQYTVYDLSLTKNSEFVLDPDYSGSQEGLFTVAPGQEDIVDAEGNSTARYGVFPSSADNEILLKNHMTTLFMTLPASFEYAKITNGAQGDLGTNEGAVSPLPLWGSVANESGSRKITFKMMTGLLKVDLRRIPANFSDGSTPAYLVVKSNAHKLSGKFKADITAQSAEEYSADAADVELEMNTPVGTETDDNQIKVTFNTDGSKIDRVFYLPIPVGTYEAGDLKIELYDFKDDPKADLTPDAWKASDVTIDRGQMKEITYAFPMILTANSIAELNDAIYDELVSFNTKSTIEEGQTFIFTVDGNALTPTDEDDMLLIPTFNGKNINVILNIKNVIDASTFALNIAEAAYGDESTAIDGQWKLKSGKTADGIKGDAAAAQRTFTVNLGLDAARIVNPNSIVNILAPTSNVYINTMYVDNTIMSLAATTADETNSLMLGVDGNMLTGTTVTSHAGGVYVGSKATINVFENKGDADVIFCGTGLAKFTKNGSGSLFIDKIANVAQLINNGTGDVIVDGHLWDVTINPSLNNAENATITINGFAETVQTKSSNAFIAGPGASITSLINTGSGEIRIQGATVTTITNNGTSAITVEEVDGKLPAVATINNGANVGAVSVTANNCNIAIYNKSKTSDILVDFAYSNGAKTDAVWTATITDDSNVMSGTATGSMTVKNTSGIVTLTNFGGNVELDNCSGDNVIVNNTQTDATITLTDSYAAALTNNNSNVATVNTSGEAGIGTPTGAFTFVDAAWDGSGLEARNVTGNIYTAAQLAALTQYPTTEATITLKNNIDLGDNANTWAGIQQGAMTIFDGGNFTISNLNLNRPATSATPVLSGLDADKIGLFATAGVNDLTIQNLKLDNVAYTTTKYTNSVGALVGDFAGSKTQSLVIKNVTVSDVNLDAGFFYASASNVAAFVGKFVGKDLTFEDASISGTSIVKGTSCLAGFIGNLGASNNVEFKSSTLSGFTIAPRSTPAISNAKTARAGRIGYLIGSVTGNVAKLTVYENCEISPSTLTDAQRDEWKYKQRRINDGTFFWGDERGYLGYCQATITLYKIGDQTQTEGVSGTYNIYMGY